MNEDPLSDLEQLIRESAPRQLPAALRSRIVQEMAKDERPAEDVPAAKMIRFPWRTWSAIAAALVLGGMMALWMGPERKPVVADAGESGENHALSVGDTSPALSPVALTTHDVSRRVGPVLDVKGQPLRLMETRGVETRTYEEPESGAVVKVSYPQTSYQLINTPIE